MVVVVAICCASLSLFPPPPAHCLCCWWSWSSAPSLLVLFAVVPSTFFIPRFVCVQFSPRRSSARAVRSARAAPLFSANQCNLRPGAAETALSWRVMTCQTRPDDFLSYYKANIYREKNSGKGGRLLRCEPRKRRSQGQVGKESMLLFFKGKKKALSLLVVPRQRRLRKVSRGGDATSASHSKGGPSHQNGRRAAPLPSLKACPAARGRRGTPRRRARRSAAARCSP